MSNEINAHSVPHLKTQKGGNKGDDQCIVTNWPGTFLHIHANLANNIISQRGFFWRGTRALGGIVLLVKLAELQCAVTTK